MELTLSQQGRITQPVLVELANVLASHPSLKCFVFQPLPNQAIAPWDESTFSGIIDYTESSSEPFWSEADDYRLYRYSAAMAFSETLKTNRTLTCLKLGVWKSPDSLEIILNMGKSPASLKRIQDGLSHNCSLTHLSIPMLCLNLESAFSLLQYCRLNKQLREFNILHSNNNELPLPPPPPGHFRPYYIDPFTSYFSKEQTKEVQEEIERILNERRTQSRDLISMGRAQLPLIFTPTTTTTVGAGGGAIGSVQSSNSNSSAACFAGAPHASISSGSSSSSSSSGLSGSSSSSGTSRRLLSFPLVQLGQKRKS